MRPRHFATVVLSLAISTSLEAANQLTNPSFTTDLTGWSLGGWTVVWTGAEGAAAPGAAQVTATAATGTGALALQQCTTATASGVYDFGAKFKIDPTSTQTGGARLRVTWWTGAGCSGTPTTDPNASDATAAVGWQMLQVTAVTAPGGTQSVLVELIQSVSAAGTFQAFWDDVYFGPNPTPVELVRFQAE